MVFGDTFEIKYKLKVNTLLKKSIRGKTFFWKKFLGF